MTNLQPVLFFFETIMQWNYHNLVEVFNLHKETTKYSDMFDEIYSGISHPQSKYEMYITTDKNTNAIGFMMEDRALNSPVLFANLQSYGILSKMWPDWMLVPMNSTKLIYDNSSNDKIQLNVDINITEEEHFQMMMLYELPPFEILHKAIEVNDYLSLIGRRHKIGFSVSYEHMDMDFKDFFPSNHTFDTIDSLFGNALELYYEAEEHGNPFSHYTLS